MSDKVLNRYISPLDAETSRRTTPAPSGVETDFSTATGQPQLTIYGHLVPPLVESPPDVIAPLPLSIVPAPNTFPFNIEDVVASSSFLITFDEVVTNHDRLSNWALSGAAAAALSVRVVELVGTVEEDGEVTMATYRISLAGSWTEGALTLTVNPAGAATPITDASGNQLARASWNWWIDLTRPRITGISPSTAEPLSIGVPYWQITVTFSEFIGQVGDDPSIALDLNRYEGFYMSDGSVIGNAVPQFATLVENEGYSFGEDAGKTVVKVGFLPPNASFMESANLTHFRFRIDGSDSLVDRAGNKLLEDALEYEWSVYEADSEAPTWVMIDPSDLCNTVQPPVELGPGVYDGLTWIDVEFSEEVSSDVLDPANWNLTATGGAFQDFYEILSIEQRSGNIYRALVGTETGYASASGLELSLNSNVTDVAGNAFAGETFSYTLETTMPTVQSVTPIRPGADWDGVIEVTFSSFISSIAPSALRNVWKLENTTTGAAVYADTMEEVVVAVGSDSGIQKHKLTFNHDTLAKVDGGTGVNNLKLVHVYNKEYSDVDGELKPRMVRAFPSATSDDKSCGGAGVPLSQDSYYWSSYYGQSIEWVQDSQGPILLTVDPPDGSTIHPSSLDMNWEGSSSPGVTFVFDSDCDFTGFAFSGSASLGSPSSTQTARSITLYFQSATLTEDSDINLLLSGVRDTFGNPADSIAVQYTIADITAPAIESVSPTSISLCHPETAELQVTFTEGVVNGHKEENYRFYVKQGLGWSITSDVVINDITMTTGSNGPKSLAIMTLSGVEGNPASGLSLGISPDGGTITDNEGNAASSQVAEFDVEVCTQELLPPENVTATGFRNDEGHGGVIYQFDPPSTGATPDFYRLYKDGEYFHWDVGANLHNVYGWEAGSYTFGITSALGSGPSDVTAESAMVTVSFVIPEPDVGPAPTITSVDILNTSKASMPRFDDNLCYGPRYDAGGDTGDHTIYLDIQMENADYVHVFWTSNKLLGWASEQSLEADIRDVFWNPPTKAHDALNNGVDNASWPLASEYPLNAQIPSVESLKVAQNPHLTETEGWKHTVWSKLGFAHDGMESLPNGEWSTVSSTEARSLFDVFKDDYLSDDYPAGGAAYPTFKYMLGTYTSTNIVGVGGNADGDTRKEWYYPPFWHNDVVLFMVIASRGVGADIQYSEPYFVGNGRNKAVRVLPEPMHDHPDWGVNPGTSNPYPVLTNDTDKGMRVDWNSRPMRGANFPPSYHVGLFLHDGVEWRPQEIARVSGESLSHQFTFKPTGSSSAEFVARVVPCSSSGESWTDLNWDDNGTGYMEMGKIAMGAGWGGRSQIFSLSGGPTQLELLDANPTDGDTLKGPDGLRNVKVDFLFNDDMKTADGNSFEIKAANNNANYDARFGIDYQLNTVGNKITIAFINDLLPTQGTYQVRIKFLDVRSVGGLSDLNGYAYFITSSKG